MVLQDLLSFPRAHFPVLPLQVVLRSAAVHPLSCLTYLSQYCSYSAISIWHVFSRRASDRSENQTSKINRTI